MHVKMEINKLLNILVKKGANTEAKDEDQYTPLHYASYYNQTGIIEYLVSKGANKNGRTTFDVAGDWIYDKS